LGSSNLALGIFHVDLINNLSNHVPEYHSD
jgi:hypothetical protein